MRRTGLAMFAAAATLASGALAQTAAAPPPTASSAVSDSTQFITDQSTSEYRAPKFVGLDVYGTDDQKIGDVRDILIDASGAAKTVVIGVGGFLGIGEKTVAVPFASLEWVNARPAPSTPAMTGSTMQRPAGDVTGSTAPSRSPAEQAAYNGYPDHAVTKLSKADLQNAPTFKYYADTHSASGAASNATTQPLTTAPKP